MIYRAAMGGYRLQESETDMTDSTDLSDMGPQTKVQHVRAAASHQASAISHLREAGANENDLGQLLSAFEAAHTGALADGDDLTEADDAEPSTTRESSFVRRVRENVARKGRIVIETVRPT